METKPLLYGLIGFFIGGLLVSVAATTSGQSGDFAAQSMSENMKMHSEDLSKKSGDEFDKAFVDEMIVHHQGAVDMAKLAESRAKHGEIKQLSKDIVVAQEKEIGQMKRWLRDWGYAESGASHSGH